MARRGVAALVCVRLGRAEDLFSLKGEVVKEIMKTLRHKVEDTTKGVEEVIFAGGGFRAVEGRGLNCYCVLRKPVREDLELDYDE